MSKDSTDIHVEKIDDGLRIEIRGRNVPGCCAGMDSSMAQFMSQCCTPTKSEAEEEKNQKK